MKNLAVIPARSGSKGLKDKNIKPLRGHPLMWYSIQAAIESGQFAEVMVSTDSEAYAKIARQCGASVPFLRSEAASGDSTGSWDVVREVLSGYDRMGMRFDYVALLQPTTPLRSAEDIRGAFQMLECPEVHNVVTVTQTSHPIQWCFRLPPDGSMAEAAASPDFYKRRQELEAAYTLNGAVYLVRADSIRDPGYNFYADHCYAYVMPSERSVDIDQALDMVIAEAAMGQGSSENYL